MEPRRAKRCVSTRPTVILAAILVFHCNYFLLFTFVHCDHDHHLKLNPNVTATDDLHQLSQSSQPKLTNDAPWTSPESASSSSSSSSSSPSRSHRASEPLLSNLGQRVVGDAKNISSDGHEHQVVTSSTRRIREQVVGSSGGQHLRGGQVSAGGGERVSSAATAGPLRRRRRMASPRVKLARRPPKSTTTTSTTTSTTTTAAPTSAAAETGDKNESQGENDEDEDSEGEPSGSDDYVEVKQNKPATSTQRSTSTTEDQTEEDEASEEDEEQPTTTSTTTTTRRPTTRKSSRKSRVKAKGDGDQVDRNKPAAKSKAQDSKGGSAEGETAASSNKLNETQPAHKHHAKKKPLVLLPFIKPKNISVCTPEAYLEFPRDFIGDKWRGRGLVIIHVLVVCYMFYSLALVCERYFMPSLEEFAQRLQISEDVAGATLMSAGSSAPELFTAILGVFVAKGDVGTGAIVGSAVFNILFVIGVCAFVSSTSAQLQWWPVLRDSIYYTFTVLVLIVIIYDERITALESGLMILLYGLYITIMCYNEQLKAYVTSCLLNYPITAKLLSTSSIQIDGPDDVFGGGSTSSSSRQQYEMGAVKTVEDDSIFMAALLVIIKHKRLFRSTIRFQSAARYIITKRQHRLQQQRSTAQEVNYFGPDETSDGQLDKRSGGAAQRAKMEAYARSTTMSKQKFSIVSKDDYEFWHRPPEEGENYFLWLARIPVNYLLHYTIPDCTLYPDKYIVTFVVSIVWTAVFSYLMVWMVTLIGYTLGIPDSVMGVTFLAAGTSVPDCYSSIHAARNGMADMAVSNSIGSNVFDILIGLSVPWFIQSAIYPGIVATINSRGVIYSVILLFLSLIVTIYLLNKYEWSLQPRLGLALLIAYGLFIILTCMLEFNLFGHVNPPPCPPPVGAT